jgi:general secretion pathway protein G
LHIGKRAAWILPALVVLAVTAYIMRSWPPPDSIRRAREAVLRQNLFTIPDLIRQYYIDKGSRPHSLDDLVRAGYARKIPTDPITGRDDTWVVQRLKGSETEIVDLHSGSHLKAVDGTTYDRW